MMPPAGPLLVSVTPKVRFAPITTLPKSRVVGFEVMLAKGATPLPVAETTTLGLEALLVMVTLALAAPGVLGVYLTVYWMFEPGAIVCGRAGPVTVKSADPLPAAPLTMMEGGAPEGLVSVTVSERL